MSASFPLAEVGREEGLAGMIGVDKIGEIRRAYQRCDLKPAMCDAVGTVGQPNRHLSFGDGPHFCAGAALARMEAQIAIPAFLARFPDLRLPADWAPRWKGGIVLRGMKEMPLKLH